MRYYQQLNGKYRRSLRYTFLAALIATTGSLNPAAAEVYRYTDENGRVVYSSQKPVSTESVRRIRIRPNTVSSGDGGYVESGNRDVVIYTAEWCGYCRSAKSYFDERGIDYSEYDIEKSRQAYIDYKSHGGSGLPLILVGDRKMSGFSRAGFERLYSSDKR